MKFGIKGQADSTHNVLLTPPDEGPRIKGQRIKLQDIIDGDYLPLRVNGTWIDNDEFLYQNQWGGISLLNANNLTEKVLMSNTTFRTLAPLKFSISTDRRFLLLAQNVQKLFRHSYLAQYTVFDIQTSEAIRLSPKPGDEEWPFLLHAQFTPRGHSLIMVYNYDVYYRIGPKSSTTYRVTKSGIPGVIYNGIPDWLYEEEILSSNTAIWMSPDGHLMLYGTFNDTLVPEQNFAWFGTINSAAGGNTNLYPEIRSLRYPKPGTQNPIVKLRVADLTDPKNIRTRDLQAPAVLKDSKEDYYFANIAWVSQTEVSVIWMNRPQNMSVTTICKSPMWYCIETHRISGDSRGWVDETAIPFFSTNATSYIAVSPLRDGASGHFRHLVYVHIPTKNIIPLTHGKLEVRKILFWDQTNNWVYYLGTPETHPGRVHLYRTTALPPKIGVPLRDPLCMTCSSSVTVSYHTTKPPPKLVTTWDDLWHDKDDPEEEDEEETITEPAPTTPMPKRKRRKDSEIRGPIPCQYHNVLFSPIEGSFAFIECLGPGIPQSSIYRITGHTKQKPMEIIKFLQNNTKLMEKVAKLALPQIKSFPVMISGGYHAQVRLHLPPGLREDEITRYPLVLHVYAGPGTQLVTDKWRIDWNTYLAGTKDYIVVQIDGRGSSGQGYQLLHEVYRRLGTVEVSDQLEVTEYLRDNLHFVDKRRVGVWGWSYGGYTAALALASQQSLFQCGISISPVTNWKLYDSTYTERYMGLPNVTDNYKGYEEGDLARYADFLRDKQLLLVHGTADDNVHFQQSMVFAKALSMRGALFKQQIYPDEGHSLSGVKRHLYRSMTSFFEDCFRKQEYLEYDDE